MNPSTVELILKFIPVLFSLFPKLVELVSFARRSPEDISDEEIVARWVETIGKVEKANEKWESR